MTSHVSREHRPATAGIGRRRLLGAGAALAAGGLGAAAPGSPANADEPGAASGRRDSPVGPTLASPPGSGLVYRYLSWLDFHPESGAANRIYGGLGCYSDGGGSPYMWGTIDVPPGTVVREIEWYIYNNSGSTLSALGRLWAAGTGTLFNTLVDTPIPTGADLVAFRSVVPEETQGPFPFGVKISLGMNTAGGGLVQINGARVGFSAGGGAVGLLGRTVKVYDSANQGGRLRKGEARRVQLPRALVPEGVSGVLLNVTVSNGERAGAVTVYSAAGQRPAGATLYFPRAGVAEANALTVPVSNTGRVFIHATQQVHVRIDLVGTVS